MQLLVWNSNVKESLIQTEAIDMQSSLRDGIITGNLPHKYHKPVPYCIPENRKWSNISCYHAWLHALTQDSRPLWPRSFFHLKYLLQQWQLCHASRRTSRWASRQTRVNRLPAIILHWPNYLLVKNISCFFVNFSERWKFFDGELFQNYFI